MKKIAHVVIIIIFIAVFVLIGTKTQSYSFENPLSFLAGVSFFPLGTSTNELREGYQKNNYNNLNKINILIVPGHDENSWGTQHGSLKEVDLNKELSLYLYDFLNAEKNFNVMITQDEDGYTPVFSNYFLNNFTEITQFIQEKRSIMKNAVNNGFVEPHSGVIHNAATSKAVIKLYGINKWSNENNIDIVIHIHFNDYAGRRNGAKEYSGIAIYVPESQYSNSEISNDIAKYIFKRLHNISSVSNLKQEEAGIVEDQELIAIGSNNSLDSAGILIEYGYIYERQFTDKDLRAPMLRELAFLTHKGLVDFFKSPEENMDQDSTSLLPYSWTKNIQQGTKGDGGVLALQAALMIEGLYPPLNRTANNCPITGSFLSCTKKSVVEFQNKYKIPGTGYVGPMTRKKLNELYSR